MPFWRDMEALLVSTGVVAFAEIGDKTQLLAFILAARFKQPRPIILGILLATLANHGIAGALGTWVTTSVSPEVLRWALGIGFLAMAVWTLIPDKLDNTEVGPVTGLGVFGTTFVAFFIAEMGDKTQIATVALAAHYATPIMVVVGTTLGMMIANVPAVYAGERLATKIPMPLIRGVAAALFGILGAVALFGGSSLGL
jgi:Ca2+/H+ antiporter, TMEM165/GDT1 family